MVRFDAVSTLGQKVDLFLMSNVLPKSMKSMIDDFFLVLGIEALSSLSIMYFVLRMQD